MNLGPHKHEILGPHKHEIKKCSQILNLYNKTKASEKNLEKLIQKPKKNAGKV